MAQFRVFFILIILCFGVASVATPPVSPMGAELACYQSYCEVTKDCTKSSHALASVEVVPSENPAETFLGLFSSSKAYLVGNFPAVDPITTKDGKDRLGELGYVKLVGIEGITEPVYAFYFRAFTDVGLKVMFPGPNLAFGDTELSSLSKELLLRVLGVNLAYGGEAAVTPEEVEGMAPGLRGKILEDLFGMAIILEKNDKKNWDDLVSLKKGFESAKKSCSRVSDKKFSKYFNRLMGTAKSPAKKESTPDLRSVKI